MYQSAILFIANRRTLVQLKGKKNTVGQRKDTDTRENQNIEERDIIQRGKDVKEIHTLMTRHTHKYGNEHSTDMIIYPSYNS